VEGSWDIDLAKQIEGRRQSGHLPLWGKRRTHGAEKGGHRGNRLKGHRAHGHLEWEAIGRRPPNEGCKGSIIGGSHDRIHQVVGPCQGGSWQGLLYLACGRRIGAGKLLLRLRLHKRRSSDPLRPCLPSSRTVENASEGFKEERKTIGVKAAGSS
jgi:hypothetical protein